MRNCIEPAQHLRFPNGDRALVAVVGPDALELSGRIAGTTVSASLTAGDAECQGYQLLGSVDADQELGRGWLQDVRERIGHALIAGAHDARVLARETAAQHRSARIALDGGHIDVDPEGEHVELTVRLCGRVALGIALSAGEAARVADALAQAARTAQVVQAAEIDLSDVSTVRDLFRCAQASGIPASALLEAKR